ncbi:MAG TPA: SAM-dependent methyltransferase [Puia sp.]|jgi:SAM-dependent MidA family methyltransferase|nr:SAM-dependent methyltransferase [Puia sp.]
MQQSDSLREIIRNKIEQEGPLSFRDFMEMALYHPRLGYYSSSLPRLGESGDFYTSAYVTGLFGELLAHQLEEMWQRLGGGEFTVVEYGAGSGLLCRDILGRLRENGPLYEKLNYFIIEKSEAMRERERRLLPEKVAWKQSIRELGAVTGCIFSNELVDNFAVHRVVMEDELMEIYVGYDGEFVEELRPAAAMLKDYLIRLGVELPRGYRAEINLEATQWIQEVGEALERGWVMTIDYGYPAATLYSKRSGTLACYHRHRVHYSPYENIGEQDITTHVNFTALDHWGRGKGLLMGGYTNQTRFLQGLGLVGRLRSQEESGMGETDRRQLRAFLVEMGQKFKVLIQRKGIGQVGLSGLMFSEMLG